LKTLIVIFVFVAFNLRSLAQINFTSSNLPIIVINTHGQKIVDEPKITADMGVIDNGEDSTNFLTDAYNGYNGKVGIEIRGHSSQMFPKKQYGIELRDTAGNPVNVPLLGMPSENDWVLNASFTDKTFLRNVLAYKLANDMGRYASRTRFCEVVINNEYPHGNMYTHVDIVSSSPNHPIRFTPLRMALVILNSYRVDNLEAYEILA